MDTKLPFRKRAGTFCAKHPEGEFLAKGTGHLFSARQDAYSRTRPYRIEFAMAKNNNHSLAVGVDVGGTKIETALVDGEGKVVDSERQPTESEKGPDHVIQDIVATVKTLLSRAAGPVSAVGLGIAGQINTSKGVLLTSPNLDWRDVALKGPLEDALKLNVQVTNDVSAATWGEWKWGAGRGENDLICVFVGTGVGSGVVTGGRMLESSEVPATELGHVPLVFDGRECSCRHRGCLEAYVGGWAIAQRAQESVRHNSTVGKAILSLAGTVEEITAKHVSEAFRKDDPLARRLVEETGKYLSAAAVGMVNTFNPSLLVFGGGVIEGLTELTDVVDAAVRDHAFAAFAQQFQVTRAELGGDAGVVGAASLARSRFSDAHS